MSELDTKINNFLSRSTSCSEFFGLLGEYVDEVLKERDDKTKANTELAEQNKDLFLECQRLEEKIKELETRAIKSPVLATQNKVVEKTIELNVETGIVQLDKDEIDADAQYTTTSFGEIFLVSARVMYDYLTFRVSEDFLQKYAKRKENITFHNYYYNIKGQLGIDELKKHNPNMEVFYRVSHLNLTTHQKEKLIVRTFDTNSVFVLSFSNVRYIKHSLVLKLGLQFKVGTSSYKRFQKYKNKKTTEIKSEQLSLLNIEPKLEETTILDKDVPSYTIGAFCEKYILNKKKLKLYLKDMLKMKLNECFPAGFTLPKNFVREFEKTVNPNNDHFYPITAFIKDDNMTEFVKYVRNIKRYFQCDYFIIGYVMQSEVSKFNLKFEPSTYHKKVYEEIENKQKN